MSFITSYGDTYNDGAVQLSFTLPMASGLKAEEAAKLFCQKLGFEEAQVVHYEKLSEEFTFFVVYGKTKVQIDLSQIQIEESQDEIMGMEDVNQYIRENIKRKVVIVGACTGFDAHTVGIDAIMNMKGYNHHYGLERYSMIEAYNLGAQVPNEKLIEFAKSVNADAILISQIVTQKDIHIQNLTEFIEMMEAEGLRSKIICVVGGPRISSKLALELGFDTGFTKGSYAEDVATYIVKKIAEGALK